MLALISHRRTQLCGQQIRESVTHNDYELCLKYNLTTHKKKLFLLYDGSPNQWLVGLEYVHPWACACIIQC